MYYSLTFKPDSTASHNRNTWADWGLIPDSPPMVPPPEVETNYVEIPGRVKGPLDLTDVMGHVNYKRITGSWTFLKNIASMSDRKNTYETLRKFFVGRKMKVVLTDDDPSHYYFGRFGVSLPRAEKNPMSITITYDLEPVRYNVSNDAIDTTWVN